MIKLTLAVIATLLRTLVMLMPAAHGANLLLSSQAARLLTRPKLFLQAFLHAIRFPKKTMSLFQLLLQEKSITRKMVIKSTTKLNS